jgi:hypothetical protein
VTWQAYGENLAAKLTELHDRIHKGSYRARPARRAYIPKADGAQPCSAQLDTLHGCDPSAAPPRSSGFVANAPTKVQIWRAISFLPKTASFRCAECDPDHAGRALLHGGGKDMHKLAWAAVAAVAASPGKPHMKCHPVAQCHMSEGPDSWLHAVESAGGGVVQVLLENGVLDGDRFWNAQAPALVCGT